MTTSVLCFELFGLSPTMYHAGVLNNIHAGLWTPSTHLSSCGRTRGFLVVTRRSAKEHSVGANTLVPRSTGVFTVGQEVVPNDFAARK